MAKNSAGILLFRRGSSEVEFMLVHFGGPFFVNKDLGTWSIPKGEYEADEDPLAAALREFKEETNYAVAGEFIPLSAQKLKSGKNILAWAVEGDFDVALLKSNTFEIEWPPRSGKRQTFPEIDRAEWFPYSVAMEKIHPNLRGWLEEVRAWAGG
jgi:predicted NUDIX family NTP pyrophosphohydrolase